MRYTGFVRLDDWPKFEANEKTSTVIEEQKRSAVMLVEVTQPKGISSILDIKAFGMAERIFRVTAWILRFISNIKAKVKKGKHCKSASDLHVVELGAVYMGQASSGTRDPIIANISYWISFCVYMETELAHLAEIPLLVTSFFSM